MHVRSVGRRHRRDASRPSQIVRHSAALLASALTALLAGCGSSSPTLDDAFEKALSLSPEPLPPYRKLVAEALKTFKAQNELTNLEISDPRWVEHLGGPAWLVCVKFNPAANPYHYAFFIRQEKIVENRFAVGTDRCTQRTFVAFDPATAK